MTVEFGCGTDFLQKRIGNLFYDFFANQITGTIISITEYYNWNQYLLVWLNFVYEILMNMGTYNTLLNLKFEF